MDEEINVFTFESEKRAATRPTAVALERRKGARTVWIVIGHQDKQRAVDGIVRLVEGRTVQDRRPILKLELPRQVAVGAYPDLIGVALIKTPVQIRKPVFANLFPDPDEGRWDER